MAKGSDKSLSDKGKIKSSSAVELREWVDLPASLIKQAVDICDDLDEVMALHHWIYDALLALEDSEVMVETAQHGFGLSLLLTWLKNRDAKAKTNLHQLLEDLQCLSKPVDCIESPRLIYGVS